MDMEHDPLREDDLGRIEMVLRRFPDVDVIVRGVRHIGCHAAFPLGDAPAVTALLEQAPTSFRGFAPSDRDIAWLAEALAHVSSEEQLVDVLARVVKQLHRRPYVEVQLHDLLLGASPRPSLVQPIATDVIAKG